MARQAVTAAEATSALVTARAGEDGEGLTTAVERQTVRHTLRWFAQQNPGHAVEIRVPPHAAVQAVEGPRHTRGTPPTVVEMDGATWLALATGAVTWEEALALGRVQASGLRADLSELLPIPTP